MRTVYGIGYSRDGVDVEEWTDHTGAPFTRESAEVTARVTGSSLIAQERSATRIVSIR